MNDVLRHQHKSLVFSENATHGSESGTMQELAVLLVFLTILFNFWKQIPGF